VLAVRSMPLSLAGDLVEVDLGWAVVELAVVGGAFEAVVVGSVSFDHSGICSVPSWGVGSFGREGGQDHQSASDLVVFRNDIYVTLHARRIPGRS
jgi:hypothetical protein